MEEVKQFGIIDYVVFAAMLMVSAGIGIYYAFIAKKNQSAKDYLMGGRNMSVLPAAISSMATVFSANGLMGFPVEVYRYGTQLSMMAVATPLFVLTAAVAYLPVFYEMRVSSAFEYLERRFSKFTRNLVSVLYCFGSLFFMTVVIYAPALALSHVTDISLWTCIISVTAVATFYTFLGGLKAVIWSDVFQATVMFAAVFTLLVKSINDEGGIARIWKNNYDGGRIEFLNLSFDPRIRYTLWGTTIGKYTMFLSLFATNPMLVQRYLSVPTLKKSKRVLYVNLPPFVAIQIISVLVGLVAYSKYRDCDPVLSKQIDNADQMLPLMVMETVGKFPGMPGLFVAGLLSAALSTISSLQNTLATLVLEDFIKPYVIPNISDLWATRTCKLLVFMFGCSAVASVVVARHMGDGLFQITAVIYGMVPSPLLGIFTLGMFFPWANTKGAIVGLLCGIGFVAWVGFGTMVVHPYVPRLPVSVVGCLGNITATQPPIRDNKDVFGLYLLSFAWYGPLSVGIILIVGMAVSFMTGPNKLNSVDPTLLSPVFHKIASLLKLGAKDVPEHEKQESLDSLLGSKFDHATYEEECKNNIKLKRSLSSKV